MLVFSRCDGAGRPQGGTAAAPFAMGLNDDDVNGGGGDSSSGRKSDVLVPLLSRPAVR
jgi:hypothetical protein